MTTNKEKKYTEYPSKKYHRIGCITVCFNNSLVAQLILVFRKYSYKSCELAKTKLQSEL